MALESGVNDLGEVALTLIRDTEEAIVLTAVVRLEGQEEHTGAEVKGVHRAGIP